MLPSNWPRWIVVPIGLALAVVSIGIALVLEPAVQSLAQHPEPTPTLPCLDYAAPLSGACVDCHTDADRLAALAATEGEGARLFVERAHVNSVHGQLGCVTCHGGTGGTDDVEVAHDGLTADGSARFEETCLLCHRDLRDPSSEELLHKPHQAVLDSRQTVYCSACHGAVGHGFNASSGETICSMGACLECHEEQDLDIASQDCGSCHVGPHDVAVALSCSDCHTSIESWAETRLSVHPVRLTGDHAAAECFACHRWPDFGGLDYVCTDCHDRPHDFGGDNCSACHSIAGWATDTMPGHTFPTDHGGADGACSSCHPGGDTTVYYCFTCHAGDVTLSTHEAQDISGIFGRCTRCHP